MGLGQFWPNFKILEEFLIGLEFSFRVSFASGGLDFFLPTGLGVSNLSFFLSVWSSEIERIFQRSWIQLIELSKQIKIVKQGIKAVY